MSDIKRIAIIGAGGVARAVMDIFDAVTAIEPRYEVLGFIVDPAYGKHGELVNGRPILGAFDWLEENNHVLFLFGEGPPEHRFNLVRPPL